MVEIVVDLGDEGLLGGERLVFTQVVQELDGEGLIVQITLETGDVYLDGEGLIGTKGGIVTDIDQRGLIIHAGCVYPMFR